MSEKLYAGLDIGTTAVKAAVFNAEGTAKGYGLAEYTLLTPEPGIVELDPECYWEAAKKALSQAAAKVNVSDIAAVTVTGQAETLVFLDKMGKSVGNAVVWMDSRAVDEAKELTEKFGFDFLFRMSGQNEILPCWPACKILHFRKHEPENFAKTACFMMVEDFIIRKLTGEPVSCRGLLPSTLYYDIRSGSYRNEVLDFMGTDASRFPRLSDPGEAAGTVKPDNGSVLVSGTKVCAGPIDHVCGCLGTGGGNGIVTATTGCTLAVTAPLPRLIYDEHLRLGTYHGADPASYVFLPWAPTAGMLLKHFRDEFCGGMSYEDFDRAAESVKPGSDGLILLPHCAGAVAPVCNPAARGVAWGITLAHKRGHWARAIMESVAYLLKDNIESLRELGVNITGVRALGGASRSKLWMQIQSDVLNLPVGVTCCEEATSLGAAMLGARTCGEDITKMVKLKTTYDPSANAACYKEPFAQYRKLNELLLPTFK